jgi:hypothetical protein
VPRGQAVRTPATPVGYRSMIVSTCSMGTGVR